MIPQLPATPPTSVTATHSPQAADDTASASFESELAVAMGADNTSDGAASTNAESATDFDQVVVEPKLSGDAGQVELGGEGGESPNVDTDEDSEGEFDPHSGVVITVTTPAQISGTQVSQDIGQTPEPATSGAGAPGVLVETEREGSSSAVGSANEQQRPAFTASIGSGAETARTVPAGPHGSFDDGQAHQHSASDLLQPAGSMDATTGPLASRAQTSADTTPSAENGTIAHDDGVPSRTAVASGLDSAKHQSTDVVQSGEQIDGGYHNTNLSGEAGKGETTRDPFPVTIGNDRGFGHHDEPSVVRHHHTSNTPAGGAETIAQVASGSVNVAPDDTARTGTVAANGAAAGESTAARGHVNTGGERHAEGMTKIGGSPMAPSGQRVPDPGNVVTDSGTKATGGKESMLAAVDGHADHTVLRQTSAQPLKRLTDTGHASAATVLRTETQPSAQQQSSGSPGREGLALPVNAEQQVQVHELKMGTSTGTSSVAPERSGITTATEQHPQGSSKNEGDSAQQERTAKHDSTDLRPALQPHAAHSGRTAVSDRIEIKHAGQPVRGHQLGSALRQEVANGVERVTLRVAGADGETASVRIVVRGDSVRATIVHNNQEHAGYLTSRIDDLYQALDRRGFNEPYVLVRSANKTEHSSPSNSSSFRDEGREAAHDRSTDDRNHRRDRDSRSRKENRS